MIGSGIGPPPYDAALERVRAAGKPSGVNAFVPGRARALIASGVRFILVGADVTLLAQGSDALASAYRDVGPPT